MTNKIKTLQLNLKYAHEIHHRTHQWNEGKKRVNLDFSGERFSFDMYENKYLMNTKEKDSTRYSGAYLCLNCFSSGKLVTGYKICHRFGRNFEVRCYCYCCYCCRRCCVVITIIVAIYFRNGFRMQASKCTFTHQTRGTQWTMCKEERERRNRVYAKPQRNMSRYQCELFVSTLCECQCLIWLREESSDRFEKCVFI